MAEAKKKIFSGIQPTGNIHIGNYLGAISNWVELHKQHDSIFCVVDYHAITVRQDPEKLSEHILGIVKTCLASGISAVGGSDLGGDPAKAVIFQQSHVSAHTELAWILNCASARISDLNKMTQFKDKAGKNQDNVSVGLYDYPVLMAADILLYNTDAVPVGEDQKQHVELARDLAKRFNHDFGDALKVPDVIIRKEGARIMGLDNPEKKMSKSASSEANFISLTDKPEIARKKIMRAVTDSGSEIVYDKEKKPAIANLLTIYSLLAKKSIKELEKEYAGKGYGDFKKDLAEVAAGFLSDFQKKYESYSDEDVRKILDEGAKKVRPVAEATLKRVKEKMGII